jgi:small subunit ribosomal protein S16
MQVIRLQRTGRTKMPLYRLVLAEKSSHVSKKIQAILGHYNPRTKELVVNKEALERALALNISCSDTAHNLLVRNNHLKADLKIPNFVKGKKNTKDKKAKA